MVGYQVSYAQMDNVALRAYSKRLHPIRLVKRWIPSQANGGTPTPPAEEIHLVSDASPSISAPILQHSLRDIIQSGTAN